MEFDSKSFFANFLRSNLTMDNAQEIYEVFNSLENGEEILFRNCCKILDIDRDDFLGNFEGTEIFDVDEDVGLTAIAAAERFGTIEYEYPDEPSYGTIKNMVLDNNNSEYMDFRQKLYHSAVHDIVNSYDESDYHHTHILAVVEKMGVFNDKKYNHDLSNDTPNNKKSHNEIVAPQTAYSKDNLNEKIEREAKKVYNSASSDDLKSFHSEVEIKCQIRNELRDIFMSDEMVQALMIKDDVLDDAYRFCVEENRVDQVFLAVFDYLEKAEREYLADKLYERAKADYNERIEEISKMTPTGIINAAYEIVILDDIMSVFEYDSSSFRTDQLKALLSCENPLWSVYHEWMHCDFSLMDDIRFVIRETADEKASEIEAASFETDNDHENDDGLEI